jgi:hypothetical protein
MDMDCGWASAQEPRFQPIMQQNAPGCVRIGGTTLSASDGAEQRYPESL